MEDKIKTSFSPNEIKDMLEASKLRISDGKGMNNLQNFESQRFLDRYEEFIKKDIEDLMDFMRNHPI